ARKEGPAAWVFPSDDPRPGEQTGLLSLLEFQGVEIHRTDKEYRIPAPATQAEPSERSAARRRDPAESSADQKDDNKPAEADKKETVIPAGSYVVRMDQPYSRLADVVLDTQYYNPRDPRSYDDTGWTLGALRNVKALRVTDASVLDVPMQKVGDIVVAGGISNEGNTYVINHNTDNALATLRLRNVPMEAAEEPFETDGIKFKAGSFVIRNADRNQLEQAAKDLGIKVHATKSELRVATHPLATPRVALAHNWQNTQNDGWYR